MDMHRTQCLNEIILSEGFGDSAKLELSRFNNISKNYKINPINPGSFGVKNKNAAEVFGHQMDSIIKKIRQGQSNLPSETAFNAYNQFLALTEPTKEGSTKLSDIDSTFKEINTNSFRKKEDAVAFKKSIDKLDILVTKNDEYAISINKLNLPDSLDKDIKLIVFNKDKKAQLLYPKSKEIGSFAHTLNSMWQRIDKIDTWGVIILVFLIDFFVPFAIYFMIRKKKNSGEDNGMVNGSNRGFFARLFGKAQPTKF
jgi:hypothetical protein